ncbi:hypothetical protein [Micromonospora chalcea]|uniref:hypothetical protein n=1 Tax=Micromonospora chalcea TaxID=1874 RepID=UPI003CFA070D
MIQAGGEAAGSGASGVAGAVDPGVEVLLGALVADQPGGPAGEAGDGIEVR